MKLIYVQILSPDFILQLRTESNFISQKVNFIYFFHSHIIDKTHTHHKKKLQIFLSFLIAKTRLITKCQNILQGEVTIVVLILHLLFKSAKRF